jgi:CubicO group peptidase (beta-lactamase class C family)
MDSRTLADAFDYIRQHHVPIHSLQIVRNGYLVLDAYFWPFADSEPHDMASVTKSITSSLIGIAIGRHVLSGVDQPVLPLFNIAGDDRKAHVTLAHLLTMTSGLDCHFDHGEITLSQMQASPDWQRFVLNLPMAWAPGEHYEYCSPGMHLLSAVVARTTGMSTLDFARRELFAPLDIQTVIWPADPQGVQHGWGDLHLQPRDMAKIGYLWLHGGRWGDRQILPPDWWRSAQEVHSHPGFSEGQEYGYGLWIYPHRTPPMFEGLGRGGQRISVVPGANLVVVLTGGGFEPGDVGDFIGRALKSGAPLPEDSAATARLNAALHAAASPPAAHAISPGPLAAMVSGRTYVLDSNPLGVRSLRLAFAGTEATLELQFGDRTDGPRPVGLDGVPRVSGGGRYGLPVALDGAWESDSIFVTGYDEVGNINAYRLRLTFAGDQVSVQIDERTGQVHTRVQGRRH